jgi:uncharacterized caspase-like protein
MVNHACLAIGINQYEFLQPLRYAQEDARAFQEFLEEKVALTPTWSWLLTEMSPSKEGRSTHPTLSNIERSIDEIAQAPLTSDDVLWCFFSGYGVNVAGQDYLMPIEGNPAHVEETGIPLQSIFGRLAHLATQHVRVFLDMSRPTGMPELALVAKQQTCPAKREFPRFCPADPTNFLEKPARCVRVCLRRRCWKPCANRTALPSLI